ncbi:MAG: hypothetical protein V3T17_04580 [Pseudomonadales bacterium]
MKTTKRLIKLLPLILLATNLQAATPQVSTSQADIIVTPIANQGSYLGSISTPVTGEKQTVIRARYGQPNAVSGPFGEPPITRWNYTDFTVYFDTGVVIHSVLKYRSQHSITKPSDK